MEKGERSKSAHLSTALQSLIMSEKQALVGSAPAGAPPPAYHAGQPGPPPPAQVPGAYGAAPAGGFAGQPVAYGYGHAPAVPGGCPHRNLHTSFTCCGITTAVLCFPIGLICCLAKPEKRCRDCGLLLDTGC